MLSSFFLLADMDEQPDVVVVKVVLPSDEPEETETPAQPDVVPVDAPAPTFIPVPAPQFGAAGGQDQDEDDDDASDENANLPIDYNHNDSTVPTRQPSAEEMSPDRHYQGPAQGPAVPSTQASGGARPRHPASPPR